MLTRFRPRFNLPTLGALSLAFALYIVFGRPTTTPRNPVVPPPTMDFPAGIAGIGVIEPRSEFIAVATELPGVVRAVHTSVGTKVAAGDLLFSLDQRDIDAQIEVLKAQVRAVEAEQANAAAQFDAVASVADQRAVARDDFNARKFGLRRAEARSEEVKQLLNQALVTKARLDIRAPIGGTVLEVNVRVGEFAPSGLINPPLIRLGDLSRMHVRVEIDEELVGGISPTQPAYGVPRSDTISRIPLEFVRFEPYVRPKQFLAVAGQRVDTRVLQIIYALPESSPARFAGQFLDVYIGGGTTP